MRRSHLFWRSYVTYLVVVVLCAAASGFLAADALRSYFTEKAQDNLRAAAVYLAKEIEPTVRHTSSNDLNAHLKTLSIGVRSRLTLISSGAFGGKTGLVLADSMVSADTAANHRDRPEVKAALRGEIGNAVRRSTSLGVDEMYVAAPVIANGKVIAVARAASPSARSMRCFSSSIAASLSGRSSWRSSLELSSSGLRCGPTSKFAS